MSFLHVICFLLTFSFNIYLSTLEKYSNNINMDNPSFQYLVLSGVLMSSGIIIPGVSKSVILLMLNIYRTYLLAVSTLNTTVLLPLVIGLAIGSIIFLSLINFCFKFIKSHTYFAIFGFVVGSILVMFPRIFL